DRIVFFFFFSSRRRHTRSKRDWSSDVCSSDLEAKMLGGIGPCGRMLCCSTFLGDFEPVSIKMAKNQNLSLNPAKISGLCGRLMCCLKYENDHYEDTKKQL